MVSRRCAQLSCCVVTACVLLGCTEVKNSDATRTFTSFSAAEPGSCLSAYIDACGTSLSLLNPMEDVEYLTRAELATESPSATERRVSSEAELKPQRSLSDHEDD